jgi:hypothetical protein
LDMSSVLDRPGSVAPERIGAWIARLRQDLDALEDYATHGAAEAARAASLAMTDDLKGFRRDLRLPASCGPYKR